MGAEDFSFFGHAGVPASFAFLGSGNAAAGAVHGLHTPQVRLKRLDPHQSLCQSTARLSRFSYRLRMHAWIYCYGLNVFISAFLNSGSAAAGSHAACHRIHYSVCMPA